MKKLSFTLAIVGALNFTIFLIIGLYEGGSASAGKIEDGRFYLGEHGNYTEVSSKNFHRSEFQSKTLWITHPLAILGIIIFGTLKANEKEEKA